MSSLHVRRASVARRLRSFTQAPSKLFTGNEARRLETVFLLLPVTAGSIQSEIREGSLKVGSDKILRLHRPALRFSPATIAETTRALCLSAARSCTRRERPGQLQ